MHSQVVQNEDGTYEIFELSAKGLEQIARDREAMQTLNLDMNEVPTELKCPRSNRLLREAVELPCCHQVGYLSSTIHPETPPDRCLLIVCE